MIWKHTCKSYFHSTVEFSDIELLPERKLYTTVVMTI